MLNDLHLNLSNNDVSTIIRLRSRALNGLKSAKSPISVKLKSPETKQDILKVRSNLRGLPYTIETYLSKKLRDRQQLLFPVMREFRSKGHHAIIQDAKLIVNGRVKIDANLENFQMFFEQFKATRMDTYRSRKSRPPANAIRKYPYYQKRGGKIDFYLNKNKMKDERRAFGDFSATQYLYA